MNRSVVRPSRDEGPPSRAACSPRARGAPFALAVVAGAALACGGGSTDSKATAITGDYVLLTVDGANVPTEVASGLSGSETLLSARLEILGATARDIKQRRRNFAGSPVATVTDTTEVQVTRRDDRTLLLRATSLPTVQPDTATLAEGIVPNGLLTWRTRSAPTNPSGLNATLVYSRQR